MVELAWCGVAAKVCAVDLIDATFWGAPMILVAPEVAWVAEPARVAMCSPVKCTSLSAIQGESPATRSMSRPVMSPVMRESPTAFCGDPMPPSTPRPMMKMSIRMSLENTSANMVSSHLRTHPRERSATPPANANGAKIAVTMMSIFLTTRANHTTATATIAIKERIKIAPGPATSPVNIAGSMILAPKVDIESPVARLTTPVQS
jgi:hypothetical protein